jgi:tetratricopeptide (TPR) repeat protein
MLEVNPEETLLQSAIEALRQGDTTRARDFLTRLLKDNQTNATYWLYMSAAVDSPKERLYCLQTALKLDPENVAARRGLVMLGAMPPDASVPPFPMNNVRPWEDKVKMAGEEDKPRGIKALWANPVTRLVSIFIVAGLFIVVAVVGFNVARPIVVPASRFNPNFTNTPTVTSLPSPSPYFRTATPTFVGPTPLVMLLESTYTPTPLVVLTPHPATEAHRAGIRYFQRGDYQNTIMMMQQAVVIEPGAADAYYYMGLSYLGLGDEKKAREMFEQGIKVNSYFAPNYVGRARTLVAINPNAYVVNDLDKAIELDPNNWEAYLERARYYLQVREDGQDPDYKAAAKDAQKAVDLNPNAPLAYVLLSEAQIGLGDTQAAVEAAKKANELDITILETYRALGQAYIANKEYDNALALLKTVILYQPDDEEVNALIADLNYKTGNYQEVIDFASKALEKNNRNGTAHLLRGKGYLALEDYEKAYDDLKIAQAFLPYVPEPNILFGVATFKKGDAGEAYTWFNKVESRMKTDAQMAELLYWRAQTLEALQSPIGAIRDWHALLALPEDAVLAEYRTEAQNHLNALYTPTPSPKPSATPKVTATPK